MSRFGKKDAYRQFHTKYTIVPKKVNLQYFSGTSLILNLLLKSKCGGDQARFKCRQGRDYKMDTNVIESSVIEDIAKRDHTGSSHVKKSLPNFTIFTFPKKISSKISTKFVRLHILSYNVDSFAKYRSKLCADCTPGNDRIFWYRDVKIRITISTFRETFRHLSLASLTGNSKFSVLN